MIIDYKNIIATIILLLVGIIVKNVKKSFYNKYKWYIWAILILLIIFPIIIAFYTSNAHSRKGSSIGWAGENSISNKIYHDIIDYNKDNSYHFNGVLSWDTDKLSTHGEIWLKTAKGEYKIHEWKDPPNYYPITENISQFIDKNWKYSIEWRYISGNSGVYIVKSEINKIGKVDP